jgi:anthranilate synthase component 2
VVRAPVPRHGKVSVVRHTGCGVFEGLPSPFRATRYHSLMVERGSLPGCLTVTAESEDGVIMGVQHRYLPIYGVQFHPESIATEHGRPLLRNFLTRHA